ncbi:MAG: hypothetical protein AB7D57_03150 [Desulfovibrionaceae bacterium]
MRHCLACLLFGLLLAALAGPAQAFDPAGRWFVRGWDPGEDRASPAGYAGEAVVTARGDGYEYQILLPDQSLEYSGAALYDAGAGVLALQYQSADGAESGVTLLHVRDDRLEGPFLPYGEDGRTGWEIWERR